MMRVLTVLQQLFSEEFGCDLEEVEMAASLDDLNIAPHERQRMATLLEELYGIPIPREELMAFESVEDAVGYIEDRMEAEA